MNKKIFLILLFIVLFTGISNLNNKASAADFPAGCSSALGYSTTTGSPCNGTVNSPILGYISGCSSALGYSITTGTPCSGGSVALQYLEGCDSTIGYSIKSGLPCNGTNVATPIIIEVETPGLPFTGAGGNAPMNILLLVSLGISIVLGLGYITHKFNFTKSK